MKTNSWHSQRPWSLLEQVTLPQGNLHMLCCLVNQLCLTLCVFVTPWAIAHQALLSTGFPRQEYWSGLPFPTSGDLPNPGIEPASLESPALAGRFFTTAPPRKPQGDPIGHTVCKLPGHTLGHIFQVTHLGTKQNTALVPKRP